MNKKWWKFQTRAEKECSVSPGQIWVLDDQSPWDKEPTKVAIVDVKDGWVKYTYIRTPYTDFNGFTMRLEMFISVFKAV